MKRPTTSLPLVAAVLFASGITAAHLAHAIPNQIGGASFINPAGMRFEDFAARPDAWTPKADLKAPWEIWNDDTLSDTSIEVIKLSLPATIFGLPSAQVLAYRQDETVTRFIVTFRPKDPASLRQLDQTLRRNLAAWAASGEQNHFRNGATAIEIHSPIDAESPAIQVIFSKASPAAVTAN